ncbi:hypothetical protein GQ457_01G010280 [Hibiscus cannabinus]
MLSTFRASDFPFPLFNTQIPLEFCSGVVLVKCISFTEGHRRFSRGFGLARGNGRRREAMGWRFGHHDRWLDVAFSGTISPGLFLGRKREYAHYKDGSNFHGCVARHLSFMMGNRWFSEKSVDLLWLAHFHSLVWPSYIVVVPAISTSATLSVTAIDGAALKVEIQAVVGVGSWSSGYPVHLRDPCLACSVIEVQSDTLDLSQLYRDGVNDYWFCQPNFSPSIISFCQGWVPLHLLSCCILGV